jgi:hypothetical protein
MQETAFNQMVGITYRVMSTFYACQ